MDSTPLVSVIIATYNAEPWVRETVNSALAQTYPSTEVIVIDDASKDKTVDILLSFGDRIRFLKNAANLGVSGARNKAINAATGDYIAFLDHDDLWRADKLEKQMALFGSDSTLGLVYSDVLYETADQQRWRSFQKNPPFRVDVFNNLLLQNFIPCLTAVIPRFVIEKVGQFRTDFRSGEDYDLFLRIAECFPIDYVDEPLATYRLHDQNFSRNLDVHFGEWVQILEGYSSNAGVKGTRAMAYVRWGMSAWRMDHQRIKGLTHIVHGMRMGIKDPKGFYIALKLSWNQRQNTRKLNPHSSP